MSIITIDAATGREVILTDAFAYNGQYSVKATGYAGTALAGAVTNFDCAIGPEDRYINGINLLLNSHAWGDTVDLQVIDKDGVLAGILYPPGTPLPVMLNQFGTNWNIDDSHQDQGKEMFNYVARLYAGVYVRVIYRSVGLVNVDIKLNCYFHQKTP